MAGGGEAGRGQYLCSRSWLLRLPGWRLRRRRRGWLWRKSRRLRRRRRRWRPTPASPAPQAAGNARPDQATQGQCNRLQKAPARHSAFRARRIVHLWPPFLCCLASHDARAGSSDPGRHSHPLCPARQIRALPGGSGDSSGAEGETDPHHLETSCAAQRHLSARVQPRELSLRKDVALHRLFQVLLAGSRLQGQDGVEGINLERVAVL